MRWVLFVLSLPSVVIGWLWVVLMMVVWAARAPKLEKDGVLTAEWRPWVKEKLKWKWSTTVGRAIIYQQAARAPHTAPWQTSTEDHELVHIAQFEDECVKSLVVALAVGVVTGNWILAAILWVSGVAWMALNFLGGMLRHKAFGLEAYRQSEHERSARAQTRRWCEGKSWLRDGNE